jgi:hypothetical protein
MLSGCTADSLEDTTIYKLQALEPTEARQLPGQPCGLNRVVTAEYQRTSSAIQQLECKPVNSWLPNAEDKKTCSYSFSSPHIFPKDTDNLISKDLLKLITW